MAMKNGIVIPRTRPSQWVMERHTADRLSGVFATSSPETQGRWFKVLALSLSMLVMLGATNVAAAPQEEHPESEPSTESPAGQSLDSWLQLATWERDFDEACARAAATDKQVLAYFAVANRGNTLGNVVQDQLLSSEEFLEWSQQFVLFAHLAGEDADAMAKGSFERFHYPHDLPPRFVFLDGSARALAKHDVGRTPVPTTLDVMRRVAAKSASYLALQAELTGGDESASHRLLLADLEMGNTSFAAASLAYDCMRELMDPDLSERVQQGLVDVQYWELIGAIEGRYRAGLGYEEYRREYDQLCVALVTAGRLPSDVEGLGICDRAMAVARNNKDEPLYKRALADHERLFAISKEKLRLDSLRASGVAEQDLQEEAAEEVDDKARSAWYAETLADSAELLLQFRGGHVPDHLAAGFEKDNSGSGHREEKDPPVGSSAQEYGSFEWPYVGILRDGVVPLGDRVAGTAIVCKALLLTPDDAARNEREEAIGGALEFLLRELKESPRDSDLGYLDNRDWAHAYALDCLLSALRHEILPANTASRVREMITLLVSYITSDESWPAGGWNYAVGNVYPCSPHLTGVTLLALFEARDQGFSVDAAMVDRALSALEKLRLETGAFAYEGGYQQSHSADPKWAAQETVPGSCARAALVELVLFRAGRGSAIRLRAAIDAFFEHWGDLLNEKGRTGTHEPPYGIAPYYFMFAHTYTALAIEALPEPQRPPLRQRMREVLVKARAESGAWNDTAEPTNCAYGTAMAMLALMAPEMKAVPAWEASR